MATNRGGSDASDAWLIGSFQRWQLIFPGRRHPRRSGAPKWSDDGMVQQPVGQRAPQSSPPLQSAARNKVEISSHGQGIETSPCLFRVQKKVRWIERGPSSCLVTKRPIKHTGAPLSSSLARSHGEGGGGGIAPPVAPLGPRQPGQERHAQACIVRPARGGSCWGENILRVLSGFQVTATSVLLAEAIKQAVTGCVNMTG
ncbi:hypothetical protein SETIT_5G248200v2 [Setaria italica]|uniref:Uncharacterized protein n=1 Tax=Setaria italica TaxID=4555 RepID=A0A368R8R7_SETIT|nr:hypothetical protein SETIT_5G248200v2 [Setaria italica]